MDGWINVIVLPEFLVANVEKCQREQVLSEGINVFCRAEIRQYVIWHFKNHIQNNRTRRKSADELGHPLKSPSLCLFVVFSV